MRLRGGTVPATSPLAGTFPLRPPVLALRLGRSSSGRRPSRAAGTADDETVDDKTTFVAGYTARSGVGGSVQCCATSTANQVAMQPARPSDRPTPYAGHQPLGTT
jgi:hypothetical protein